MANKRIDTQAVIGWYRMEEQAGDPPNPAAGFAYLYVKADGLYVVQDDGTVLGPFRTGEGGLANPGGRLTGVSGTPVDNSDVNAITILYYTPYAGNKIALYDGSKWDVFTFTELDLSLVGYTASRPYDIWVYDNSGTITLDSTIWTDGLNRATALVYQDGILVKSGDATRRYIGTIYINSTGGQTDDEVTKRFIWNYNNRVRRGIYLNDNAQHLYSTATWRYRNNDSSLIVEYILGVQEEPMSVRLLGVIDPTVSGRNASSCIGLDGGTAGEILDQMTIIQCRNVEPSSFGTTFDHLSIIGYHFLSMMEFAGSGAEVSFDRHIIDGNING